MGTINTADPFAGWTMANVGCHWSRQLPDGRMAYLSTWQTPHNWGHPDKRSGYSLTVDYEDSRYDDLASALTAFDAMAVAK
jgi:hypothetical protein